MGKVLLIKFSQNFFQTEFMAKIYSESLARTTGKVLLMKFS